MHEHCFCKQARTHAPAYLPTYLQPKCIPIKYLSIFSIATNKQFAANFIGQQPVSTLEIKLFAKCVSVAIENKDSYDCYTSVEVSCKAYQSVCLRDYIPAFLPTHYFNSNRYLNYLVKNYERSWNSEGHKCLDAADKRIFKIICFTILIQFLTLHLIICGHHNINVYNKQPPICTYLPFTYYFQ